jgi:hypothetical protein
MLRRSLHPQLASRTTRVWLVCRSQHGLSHPGHVTNDKKPPILQKSRASMPRDRMLTSKTPPLPTEKSLRSVQCPVHHTWTLDEAHHHRRTILHHHHDLNDLAELVLSRRRPIYGQRSIRGRPAYLRPPRLLNHSPPLMPRFPPRAELSRWGKSSPIAMRY